MAGLLKELLYGSSDETEDDAESEEEIEEEDDEPETETIWSIETEVTETHTEATVEVQFASGRSTEITYHDYEQSGDHRVYKSITEYQAKLDSGFHNVYPVIDFEYEVEQEVSLHNVETIVAVEGSERTFTAPLGFEVEDSQLWDTAREWFEDHEDAESFEREVDDGDSE